MGQKPWACTWPSCGYLGGQEFQTLLHIDRWHLRQSKTLIGTDPRQFLKTNKAVDLADGKEVEEVITAGGGASSVGTEEKRKSLPSEREKELP